MCRQLRGAAACAAVVSSTPRGSRSTVRDAASSSQLTRPAGVTGAPSGEDLAVSLGLPAEYPGVVSRLEPGSKPLTLSAAFMIRSYVPVVAGASPSRAVLSDWWKQVARAIRLSYNK